LQETFPSKTAGSLIQIQVDQTLLWLSSLILARARNLGGACGNRRHQGNPGACSHSSCRKPTELRARFGLGLEERTKN